jgi:hypothetical protein
MYLAARQNGRKKVIIEYDEVRKVYKKTVPHDKSHTVTTTLSDNQGVALMLAVLAWLTL